MESAVEAHELTKMYRGGVRALDGVSFTVAAGQIFGYLGRNGAGKTTTVRILTGLTRATSGSARVAGVPVDDWRSLQRKVGMAMQDSALDDLMSGREHLELAARLGGLPRRAARRRAGELLHSFGLEDAAERLVATYSGGMRRRLDVAMALLHRPPVLFLDEPTTGLDPQSRRVVWDIIRDLRDQASAVFLTSQYIEEVERLADQVAILHAGRVVAAGTPSELKSLLGSARASVRIDGDVEAPRLQHVLADATLEDRHVHVDLTSGVERLTDVLLALREAGVTVEGVSVFQPSLEDVFVYLTGERLQTEDARGAVSTAAARRILGMRPGRR
ncbi:MAG: ATP-binding cassette domain-containing protein [Nitriliruptorales bacterium]